MRSKSWILVSRLQMALMCIYLNSVPSIDKILLSVQPWEIDVLVGLMFFEADRSLHLQTSFGCGQEEQSDGSFPVGGLWQLGRQDLTGHPAGESGRRSHHHSAQKSHGRGFVKITITPLLTWDTYYLSRKWSIL